MEVAGITGKRVAVIGLARSGLAVMKLLWEVGAELFGSDARPLTELGGGVKGLMAEGVDVEAGGHTDRVLEGTELVVVSPGVPLDIPILNRARGLGIPTVSEVEVAYWLCEAPVVAVTGSNGKTTVAALLGEIFKRDGKEVAVAGNIGVPLSSLVKEVPRDGIVVVEVSSFQLEGIVDFKPKVSVILNITPDHLDRHSGFEQYVLAKARIVKSQDRDDHAVLNADDPVIARVVEGVKAKVWGFSREKRLDQGAFVVDGEIMANISGQRERICGVAELGMRGPHNLSNALAAVCVALVFGVRSDSLREGLRRFSGMEHRLELVREVNGVKFVNDSKATNLDAVRCALQSFPEPMVLIAGGRDKGSDFTLLRRLVAERVKALVLMGEAADKIERAMDRVVRTSRVENMEEAVAKAFALAEEGDCVLLSPACASFDMFCDFEDRGRKFKEAVEKLAEHTF